MDYALLTQVADTHPEWHLMMIGPFAKVEPEKLPFRENIHYLGKKNYHELPAYLAGWDVALLPFALNRTTQFISPTKTPEYLAGGVPVVSTAIRDVIQPYGEIGLVSIAKTAAEFIKAIESILSQPQDRSQWLAQVDELLSQNSWDITLRDMVYHIDTIVERRIETFSLNFPGVGSSPPLNHLPLSTNHTVLNHPAHNGNGHSKEFDFLIVGAGFAGSILAERLASGSGKKVLVIDRRPHIAGNAYDHYDESGLLVHQYGPHIFHTNSYEVFTYLSQFTDWRPYEHRVRASVDGQLMPMPINLDTINALFGTQMNSMELEKFFETLAEPRGQIRTSEDVVVNKVGHLLYEKFFRNYTRKQWGLDPSELDASVTSRVPIRLNRDDRYFTDSYQSMPLHGYTRMFENILDHPNIRIMLNTDYRDVQGYISYQSIIFTGPIDEFFDFRFGKLPYRSLQFKFKTFDQPKLQPVAVVNYPNEHLYTRSTEFKHLTGQEHPKTTLVYEYPCSEGDPYYPIPRPENAELYKKYRLLAENLTNVHFCGRLGTYKYYNMDQVAAQALTLYSKITGVNRSEASSAYTSTHFGVELPCSLLIQNME
jgi:UDP-galactopyranose mutase